MPSPTCPLDVGKTVDLYFMEHRAKLLDIAAFLDRLDRSEGGPGDDVRIRALKQVIPLLIDGQGDRTQRILARLSDHSSEPIAAAHTKAAIGVDPRGDY
ncbi:MAG: hypothetical protein ACO3NZ_09105 [Pirellulales bacterium]|jgi:hypothetical protein